MKNKNSLIKKPNAFLKVLEWIGLSLVALVLLGFIYEQISEYCDKKTLKASGQMIQVGDHKMHIYCTGENKSGSPTVILEAGAGNFYVTWSKIQPAISKETKVCSYDRAGLGFSEDGRDKSIKEVAANLHGLLQGSGITGDMILVGHSIGGAYARVYYGKYPDNIRSLVLIDPAEEHMAEYIINNISPIGQQILNNLLYFGSYFGLGRLADTVNPYLLSPSYRSISKNDRKLIHALGTKPKSVHNALYEGSYNSAKSSLPALREVEKIKVPVIVLGADYLGEYTACQNGHKELANRSPFGECVLVKDTNHYIQIDQPEIVIEKIKELLK
ncbi:MAG: alpha/beta hydrolase [Patescibacteria group bacterium]